MAHYKFRQYLANKCSEYDCKLYIKTEEYTSQLCSKCLKCSSNYIKREKICTICNYSINRDYNGARNIAIKNLQYLIDNI